ncbi:MAG: hypothetical protein GY803_10100 [Chloroflexi bacterium]|nr:hypothetical protein [Chloroflexota bacterium]
MTDFIRKKQIYYSKNIWMMVFITIAYMLTGCVGSGAKYDFDKQDAFMERFSTGMSRHEVEAILQQLEQITFKSERQRENEEIVLVYATSEDIYGTFEYTFVFSDEIKLIKIVPAFFTD